MHALKLENSILNFQLLFNVRNMELNMLHHRRKICLWSVTLKAEDICTCLDAYTSEQRNVPVHAK